MSEVSQKSQCYFLPESLLSRLMGDADLMKQVLDSCLPDLLANRLKYLELMDREAFGEARKTIHRIKGSALNSDFRALAVLAREIEDSLKSGYPEDAQARAEELSRVVDETVRAVEGYFRGPN